MNLGNTLDRWIISFTQSLVLFVHQEMAGKSLFTLGAKNSWLIEMMLLDIIYHSRNRLRSILVWLQYTV